MSENLDNVTAGDLTDMARKHLAGLVVQLLPAGEPDPYAVGM